MIMMIIARSWSEDISIGRSTDGCRAEQRLGNMRGAGVRTIYSKVTRAVCMKTVGNTHARVTSKSGRTHAHAHSKYEYALAEHVK